MYLVLYVLWALAQALAVFSACACTADRNGS